MMVSKTSKKILIAFFLAALVMPAITAAKSPDFRYRSTVFGTGVRNAGSHVNEIVGATSRFSENQSVFFLTRIFAIDYVDRFQFRHELYDSAGRLIKRLDSDVFSPRRGWWSETYYWNGFSPLNAGEYKARVFIRIDGKEFRLYDTKSFTVTPTYHASTASAYYPSYSGYNTYKPCICPVCPCLQPSYTHSWTRTGVEVYHAGGYEYGLRQEKNTFTTDEAVSVLTKLANISHMESFRIRHELYLSDGRLYDTRWATIKRPEGTYWYVNYSDTYFGKLPTGNHKIVAAISVNNGAYQNLSTNYLTVIPGSGRDDHYCSCPPAGSCHTGYSCPGVKSKSIFQTSENVVVSTSFSRLAGLDSFTVQHLLYRGGEKNPFMSKEAPTQYPRGAYWPQASVSTEFGKLPAGDYEVRVLLSVNHGSYQEIDRVGIRVYAGCCYDPSEPFFNTPRHYPDYIYEGTRTGAKL